MTLPAVVDAVDHVDDGVDDIGDNNVVDVGRWCNGLPVLLFVERSELLVSSLDHVSLW